MRLLLYVSLAFFTILGFNTQPVNATWGLLPILLFWPIWSNCCWLWYLFGWCQQSGGQQAATATTPPIVCGTGTFLWNGQCLSSFQLCTAAPNSGTYASSSGPCSCAPPGQTLTGKTECTRPANGAFHCETASNGASSKCVPDCDQGYTSTDGVTCIKAKLKPSDCNPGDNIATTTVGGACACVPAGTAATPTLQLCPAMVFNSASTPPGFNGDMSCVPQTGAVAKCTPDCDPNFAPFGQAACQ